MAQQPRPLMTAIQTNVPRNEEELAAATARRLEADKKEQEAHEQARKVPEGASLMKPEDMAFMDAAHDIQRSLYEQARLSGTEKFHVTALMYATAVAAMRAKGGLPAMIGFITVEHDRMVKGREEALKQAAMEATAANEAKPQGEQQ